jgi:hypothetical protein
MTTLDQPRLRPARDTRTLRRTVAALLLPLGPLTIAIIRGVLPYKTGTDHNEVLDAVAGDPAAMRLVMWMVVLAIFTLLPSILIACRVAMRRAPVLATISLGLLVPAFVGLMIAIEDHILYVAATGGYDRSTMVRFLADLSTTAPQQVGIDVYVTGHLIGMVLLGIALWRSGAIPAWAGIAVAASQPLHLTAVLTGAPSLVDGATWGLVVVGFTLAAYRVLRTPNDEWDLPPAAS